MVAEWQRGAIVLVVFGWVGLGVGELCSLDLIGVGKVHRWSGDGVYLPF